MRGRALSLVVVGLVMAGGGTAGAGEPWVWPLAGPPVVVRPYDPPATRYGPGHRGADLAGRPGQAVLSAGAGRVTYAGLLAGRGVVVVSYGALRSTYEPVEATVRVGQLVAAGQQLGRLDSGHAGCPGACLHWGLLRGEVYLDPVRWVRGGPSRLLPVDGGSTGAVTGAGRTTTATGPTAAATPEAGAAARPATAPELSLRSADRARAGVAVLALLCGLALLRRPRRSPPAGPATSGALLAAGVPPEPAAVNGAVVDLTSERVRRRAGVA